MPTDGESEKTERYPLIVSTGGGLTIVVYLLIPEGIEFNTSSSFVPPKTVPPVPRRASPQIRRDDRSCGETVRPFGFR